MIEASSSKDEARGIPAHTITNHRERMMSQIEERLRQLGRLLSKAKTQSDAGFGELCNEAAAEIERLRSLSPDRGENDGRANARLIADMLEALRGVVRVADRKTDEFDAARAAIAKAEGIVATEGQGFGVTAEDTPPDRASIIEECAKVADAVAEKHKRKGPYAHWDDTPHDEAARETANEIASTIRALAKEE